VAGVTVNRVALAHRTRPPAAPPGSSRPPVTRPATIAATLLSAVLRAAAAVLSGLLLVGGLALLLWAVTPDTGADATALLRGGVVAFGAAHFLPVSIGGVPLTLHPLMLTLIAVGVLASSAGRGRMVHGRLLEAVHAVVLTVGYAALVNAAIWWLSPPGAVRLSAAPAGLAAVAVLLGLALHRTSWNRWWRRVAPVWARVGLRAGGAAACVLAAAGTLAVVVGLVVSFRDASAVARLTAATAGDGFGLFLLCVAFLPNAAAAGIGYVTGAGFTVGGGSYSPLLVRPTELPAVPLLAAAPEQVTVPRMALLAFAGPLLAAVLVAVVVIRRVPTRRDRLIAAGLASLVAGGLVAAGTAAARGGVAGGPWATTGVPALLAGGLTAALLGVVSVTWTGLAGLRAVPWGSARNRQGRPVERHRPAGDEEAGEPPPTGADGAGPAEGEHADPSADGGSAADRAAPAPDAEGTRNGDGSITEDVDPDGIVTDGTATEDAESDGAVTEDRDSDAIVTEACDPDGTVTDGGRTDGTGGSGPEEDGERAPDAGVAGDADDLTDAGFDGPASGDPVSGDAFPGPGDAPGDGDQEIPSDSADERAAGLPHAG
jgi:hypothetical protein